MLSVAAYAMGDQATLLDCENLDHARQVMKVLEVARASGRAVYDECVIAAQTVLVMGGIGRSPEQVLACVHEGGKAAGSAESATLDRLEVVVPVTYDGPDLQDVAAFAGISVDEVIARHTGAEYSVGFSGFVPGFVYLSGGDPLLEVPRRSSPRTRIPAGAVGLAGPYSGIYPRESPGGWQIIGVTDLVLWDVDRTPPATLVPGARIRFEASRQSLTVASSRDSKGAENETTSSAQPRQAEANDGTPALKILEPGLQTLIEDMGRPGFADMGVGRSGAADTYALQEANRLVGNTPDAAALEIGLGYFAVEALRTAVIGITGAPRAGTVLRDARKRQVVLGEAFRLDPGDRLELGAAVSGVRSVLAVRGGIEAAETLGSASHDTLSRLGTPVVQRGDVINYGTRIAGPVGLPVCNPPRLPRVGEDVVIRITRGPRAHWFDTECWEDFTTHSWEVLPQSDRVGLRLNGVALSRKPSFQTIELPSEGVVNGAIQVPPNGQPVLFLTDHPVTGGYPVIGVVTDADLGLVAQVPAGARVRFELDEF